MFGFKKSIACALLVFGLSTNVALAQDQALRAALQAKSASANELADAVANGGTARVIIRLRGGLDGPQQTSAADGQQNRALQETFATRFMNAGRATRAGLRKLGSLPMLALNVNSADLQSLSNDNQIERIWVDEATPGGLATSVPLIGMTAETAVPATGAGTIVAILDTGVNRAHPFLNANVVRESCFSTFVSGQSTSLCPNGTDEQHGTGAAEDCTGASGCAHGSHVAGIAAGSGNGAGGTPTRGVAPNAKIYAIQVFSRFPGTYSVCTNNYGGNPCVLTYTSDQIAALDYIRTQIGTFSQTMVAANMSLGGGNNTSTCDGDSRKPVIDQLKALNVATVIASGNDYYTNATGAPGCISTAVTVGSTTSSDALSGFSNSAAHVDLLAPGSSIYSTAAGGTGFTFKSGTSMATPHVTGAFAAIRSVVPSATVDQIVSALASTGTPVADTRSGGVHTKPRIRVDLALSSLGYVAPKKAEITSPVPGSTFDSSVQSFYWTTGRAASAYWLYVGNAPGAFTYYNSQAETTSTIAIATGLPLNGSTIHARLWTKLPNGWEYNDYTFATINGEKSNITSPGYGTRLPGANTVFNWTAGTNVTANWLHVGTSFASSNLHDSGQIVGTSRLVTNLPTNGTQVYARLWSLISGVWRYRDYEYQTVNMAAMLSPAAGIAIGTSTTFNWSPGASVSTYYLSVGTSVGGTNVFASQLSGTSATVGNIPLGTVYVRLWSLISGAWYYQDYTYTGVGPKAVMVTPAPGTTLPGGSVSFSWSPGTGVSSYWLQVGTSTGLANLHDSGALSNTGRTVMNLPTNGSTIYVRLWSLISGAWQAIDYTYTAPVAAVMTSPANGATLTNVQTFTWSSVSGATEYWLQLGQSFGGSSLYSSSVGTLTSQTFSGFSNFPGVVYFRLWTKVGGAWYANDYQYTVPAAEPGATSAPATGQQLLRVAGR